MSLFTDRFKKAQKKADEITAGVINEPKIPASGIYQRSKAVARYNVVKRENGAHIVVGFNLPLEDAVTIEKLAHKRMTKLPYNDDDGGPLYEITITEVKRIN